jgi:phosphatidylglycerophosphatase GEP4
MVQSINTKALLTLASVIRHPSLLVPQVSVAHISQLNYTALYSTGIRAVIFDKDNTVTAPYENTVHPLAARGLEDAVKVFGNRKVAILSNSAGTLDDPDFADATEIEASLGIAVIRHSEKKPGGLNEVLKHFEMEDPAALCVVGDRLLTDVVFGSLHGMLTVHTLPLCQGADNVKYNWTAKWLRPLENGVLYGRGGRLLTGQRASHKLWPGEEICPLILKEE